ncbi:hypothetical protein LXA43DRAFT_671316 [Ganoderma leucocontextum]|nr:hypothetical protein LXA43DRAFT_671316 [Ganoderma leucocontextum]
MRKNTFATVLLRDGLIYFLSLLMLNSLHLILTMLSDSNIPSLQDASFVSLFAEPLTTILVSRFLLHLQSAKHKTVGTSTFTITSSEGASIMFDRVIGSLDQSLSVDDFFGVDMDVDETVKDSSKDYKGPIGCEVIELPLRSPSTEGAVDCDIVEAC